MASILRPAALRPGDTVAIAALSNERDPDEASLFEQGVAVIESLGFRVVVSPLAEPGHSYWWAVAPPDETAEELNRLLGDPAIRGIFALDGGQWVPGYLDLIDLDAIRADPKPIVGSSDISVLLLALHSRVGLVGIHGATVVRQLAEFADLETARRSELTDAYRSVLTGAAPIRLPATDTWERWRGGRAEGPLIGAMLNRIIRVQASGFAIPPERFDGAILFWEDAWSQSSKIWQELHFLRTAGIFDRISGMVVGAGLELTFVERGPDNLRDIVLAVLGDREIPVIGNVELGHTGPNLPMPLGVRAALDADALTLSLVEPAVSS
jgi:muramoyltetrapeptide carboxypeptidase LdcA involved in peptidoglycan recycling